MPSRKVCHLTTAHPPFDVRIFHKECKTLLEGGYEVFLAACHAEDTFRDGINVKALPKPRDRRERMTKTIWLAYKRALETSAQIYHFHDPELIPVGLLLKGKGKTVLYDVHEDYPKSIISSDRNWLPQALKRPASWITAAFERIGAFFFDGVVAATPAIARRFVTSRTIVVNNYPFLNELRSINSLPYDQRPQSIIYVGLASERRGIKEILMALGLMPANISCRLLLAGVFDSAELETEMQRLSEWDYVDYRGWLTRPDVSALMGEARAGLVTFHPIENHTEAQPNKLFEYMSAGIPVIASDFPLWREIVKVNQCGLLVDPLDPKDIAKAILWLLEHPQEAQEMGRRGQKAVFNKYNWESEGTKLINFYKGLLS